MNPKLSLVIVLVIAVNWLGITAIAQTDHFSNSTARWNVINTIIDSSPYDPNFIGVNTTVYGFKGDTSISNQKWLKMFSTSDSSFLTNLKFEGYIYSNNNIVLFSHKGNTIDTLYDFNINYNDSVYFDFPVNIRPKQYIKAKLIDSVTFVNDQYKQISFNEPTGPSAFDELEETWIQGIGSVHGPLHPLNLATYSTEDGDANETDLACTKIKDALVYSSTHSCFEFKKNTWKSWYPVGATWHINNTYGYPSQYNNTLKQGYNKYQVVKDTIVGNKKAQLITGIVETDQQHPLPSLILREENGQSFFWNGSEFILQFDINLIKGDTLYKLSNPKEQGCDTGFVIIDSVGHLTVGGETLIVQHLSAYSYSNGTLLTDLQYSYSLIERVGILYNWTFGSSLQTKLEPFCAIADNFWNDGSLRCYEEPNGLYYNAKPTLSSCDVNTNSNLPSLPSFKIYPNPVFSTLTITEINNPKYGIVDVHGKTVLTGQGNEINVEHLINGLYFLRIHVNGQVTTLKFSKQ